MKCNLNISLYSIYSFYFINFVFFFQLSYNGIRIPLVTRVQRNYIIESKNISQNSSLDKVNLSYIYNLAV